MRFPTQNNTTLANQYDVEVWGVETVLSYALDSLSVYANHSYSDGDQKDLDNGKTSHMSKTGRKRTFCHLSFPTDP